MKLLIGGAFQGKLSCALAMTGKERARITEGAVCAMPETGNGVILNGFHLLVRRSLDAQEGAPDLPGLEAFVHSLKEAPEDMIVICDELGCGVVPFEEKDRLWREKTGRLLCEIAGYAGEVYRVTAGIPLRIK